ncbi:MAG: polysaccharide pyruvyl transferase family protein [Pseudomonadota bacterium]
MALPSAVCSDAVTQTESPIPLAWAAGVWADPPYVNVGDALSPMMVALVSRRPVSRAGMVDRCQRLAAVGTIGQNLRGGRVHVWGTGCSPRAEPLTPGSTRPFVPDAGTQLMLSATRGPYSARLLGGGQLPAIPFGDPAMLLPRYYSPPIEKRWELGVVLHLSELADRSYTVRPKPAIRRYDLAPGEEAAITLITMVAPPDAGSILGKIDEIRACRRIVSTSLHGIALAEAYDIPNLYLGASGGTGMAEAALDPDGIDWPDGVNARFPDLAAGLGRRILPYWRQPKARPTDWAALIEAIDRYGSPAFSARPIDERAAWETSLISALPFGSAEPPSEPGTSLAADPLIANLPFLPARRVGLSAVLQAASRFRRLASPAPDPRPRRAEGEPLSSCRDATAPRPATPAGERSGGPLGIAPAAPRTTTKAS